MGQTVDPAVRLTCTHCGEPCRETTEEVDGKSFCCHGCAAVYSILAENNLLDFYAVDERAGQPQTGQNQAYDWLDVPKLAASVVRYRDERRWHVELSLPAIHCASCLWLLERLPQMLPGVASCRVNFAQRKATVVFDPETVSLRVVAERLAAIGYPPHFRADGAEAVPVADRSLLYKIGVAGFCFGNIMLLSFPEYFGLGPSAGSGGAAAAGAGWVGGAMRYLLLLLSLPVIGYAGRDFISRAAGALRDRRVTIDLPIAIGMLALFGRSVFEIVTDTGGGYLDSLAGLVFFLLVGRWFQQYTFSRLDFSRDYRDYFPVAAYREDAGGVPQPVASEDVAVGDVLLIRPGQIIPADGTLLSTDRPSVDYSFVTGEAEPQVISPGAEVFAGGRAVSRPLRVAVTKTTAHSYLLQLWRRDDGGVGASTVAPPEWLTRVFTAALLLIAAVTFAFWYGKDEAMAYRAATAVLIIACPCALALAAPFAYGTLQRLLARRGYYLRGPAAVRDLAAVDTFIFDKTGTLTATDASATLRMVGTPTPFFNGVFLALANRSSHPKSKMIARELAGAYPETKPVHLTGVEEVTGAGLAVDYQGRDYRIGNAAFCGLRSYRPGTFATVDGIVYFSLCTPEVNLRPGMDKLLSALKQEGEVWLLSGDRPQNAEFWEDHLPPTTTLFGQSPFAKQARIDALTAAGHRVLMVGDGINDAGALRAAHVGLAVNEDEAQFNPACDGIVRGQQLHALPCILRAARRMPAVLWLTYLLAFAYNAVGLSYAVTGTLSPVVAAILMPLSSVSIVVVASLGAALVARLAGPPDE